MFPPGLGYADVTGRQGRNAPALALPPPCPLLRVQGPVPAVYRQCVLAHAGTRQVIAYHCVLAPAGTRQVIAYHCVLAHAGTRQVIAYHCVLAHAGAPHVSACHCEPVRTLVWQSVLLRQHKPKSSAYGEYETACAFTPVPPSCTRAHLPTFCLSLRPCTRAHVLPSACHCEPVRTLVWQSVLLRQHRTKSNPLGEYEKHCKFAPGKRGCRC